MLKSTLLFPVVVGPSSLIGDRPRTYKWRSLTSIQELHGNQELEKTDPFFPPNCRLLFKHCRCLAALKFHNEKGVDNFYSLHSWLGIACLLLFAIQWAVGFTTFWYPGGSKNSRAAVHHWHIFLGIYIYALSVATAITRFLEKATFLQSSHIISHYSTEALLINSLGILVAVLGGLVILAVVLPPATAKGDFSELPLSAHSL
ncbi:hypothetical protein SAY86_005053 [Trapa natans]|uniref:Cytochrome b561 domain-containing protein n=1 Tax=Trapa natans TaxID=22666 RepID=A0AAN7L782_TRANT|nr:hypothetical protein SAY86_005053 [Trapa natans]